MIYRPTMLGLLCADGPCSAERLSRMTVIAQLRFLLFTLLLDMNHDTPDRFMRDAIGGCYSAERFFLLHHTLHDCRPLQSGNTVVRMFLAWPSALEKENISLNEFISRQQVLHLQIRFFPEGARKR